MGARWIFAVAGAGLALVALPAGAVAATIETDVTSDELNDDADCSLREAVQAANTNDPVSGCTSGQGGSKLDTIMLIEEDYELTIPSTNENENADGDLDYTGGGKLKIVGQGADQMQIRAPGIDDRAIEADGDAGATSLTLDRLGISNGDVSSFDGNGGNVYAEDVTLKLLRTEIISGEARGDALSFGSGGGVYVVSDRPFVVSRSRFIGNDGRFGGAFSAAGAGDTTIERSEFLINEAATGAARGGAISTTRPTVITDTTFDDNTTISDGGGSALGGGIYAASGDLVVRRSLFTGNDALEESEVVGARGGAVYVGGQGNKIVNTTFDDNTSADEAGGVKGVVAVSHSTFIGNQADDPGDHIEGGVTVRNSILPGASVAVDLCGPDVVSKGFNVMTYDDPDCGTLDSDVIAPDGIGFVLAEPDDYGGPTETVAITNQSPARDLIPKRDCKVAKGEDQRGFERPKGPRCDAGAFERGAKP